MAESRRKIVKGHWGSRTNFQASYGLRMTPEDLAEGDAILDAMRGFDAANLEENDGDNKEAECGWVKTNRRRYEAAGRSGLKEAVAGQLAEEYNFTPTGDPEMDLIIAMGLRDMKGDAESSHTPQPGEPAVEVGAAKSKQQRKRERKRESAKKHNQGADPNKDKLEAESQWVKTNRERYEAEGRSELKEAVAGQMAEEHKFTSTGDPEMDLIIGMGLRDMKGDPEFSHIFKPGEGASSNLGGPAVGTGATKSKRQRKRERQRENERKRNQENDVGKETESEWVRTNRERYEAGGRSFLKEIAAEQWAEEYNFTQTGDPEMDMIIAMGLRDMKDDPEFSHMFESEEPTTGSPGGPAVAVVAAKSKQQRKRERQRENAGGRRWSAKELEEESRRLAELLRVHHA